MKTKILFTAILAITSFANAQFTFNEIQIWSGGNSGTPQFMTEYNGELYFSASNISNFVKEMWKTDGTQNGTVMVKDLNGAGAGSNPESFTVFNNELYFTAFESGIGTELYKTNGTEAGTVLVKDVRSGNSSGLTNNANGDKDIFKEFNNELYFIATTSSGTELWKTDGTTGGTVLVKNFNGTDYAAPQYIGKGERQILGVEMGGELFFVVIRDGSDYELWKTDGTTVGTEIVRTGFESISELIVYDNILYFAANDTTHGDELWKSDGTSIGTELYLDIFPNNLNPSFGLGSGPDDLIVFNNELYFTARGYDVAQSHILGDELYKTDGTNSELIKDIKTGNLNSGINLPRFVELNNELYFVASDDTTSDYELWKTDGTESGTVKAVSSIDTGESFQLLRPIAYGNNIVYHNSQQLWVTDGTSAGTEKLTDNGNLNDPILTYAELVSYQQKLWFSALNNFNGRELWSLSDNTLNINDIIDLEFLLYPNPAHDEVSIKSKHNIIIGVEIIDATGKLIMKTTKQKHIDISKLNTGMYLLKIATDKGTFIKKLAVK